MKKNFLSLALILSAVVSYGQTTATNWTATDCSSVNHTLFAELDAGKVIVCVWVMPCGSCIGGAQAAYNAAQSFATSHPGKVLYYIVDDMGNDGCTDLNNWITANSIGSLSNMSVFSNAGNVIKESDFGGSGMPHVVVMGGTDHKIYFNKKNSAAADPTGIENAITSALATTGINDPAKKAVFSVVPNPATEIANISYPKAINKINISSMSGQSLKEESFKSGRINPSVNLSGLAAGNYLIYITDIEGNTGVQKIVKE